MCDTSNLNADVYALSEELSILLFQLGHGFFVRSLRYTWPWSWSDGVT